MNNIFIQWSLKILGVMAVTQSLVFSYPEIDECPNLSDSDFRQVTLMSNSSGDGLNEPIDMEFVMDEQGDVNIYFVERGGAIKYYSASDGSISNAGEVNASTLQNHGLVGIVKDPGFESNHWMYLFYTNNDLNAVRISRFTVDVNQHEFMTDTEKPIIQFPVANRSGIFHTGGAMYFDDYGDLWIAVGDINQNGGYCDTQDASRSGEDGPSNTSSFLGSILRIRPLPFPDSESPSPGLGSTYEAPDGNFGDHFAEVYPDRADEFRDPDLVNPAVYAKGARNPYTLALDPVKRWIGWGDCGPDPGGNDPRITEEHNLITEPGFMGWPYFAGNNVSQNCNKNPDAPMNTNPLNTGITELPPAQPAIIDYERSCAMTGPIVRYDGDLQSNVKMPPHFNNVWLVSDFSPSVIDAVILNDAGDQVVSKERIFSSLNFTNILGLKAGPDGALYVNNYAGWYNSTNNTSISKIEYTGNCDLPDWKLPHVGCLDSTYAEYDPTAAGHDSTACKTPTSVVNKVYSALQGVTINAQSIAVDIQGDYRIRILQPNGKTVADFRESGPGQFSLQDLGITSGVSLIRVETDRGIVEKKIVGF